MRTIQWIDSSVRYFTEFLGEDRDLTTITPNDIRDFFLEIQGRSKYLNHPFTKPDPAKLSSSSVNHYCRAIRLFFNFVVREGLIDENPLKNVKIPKVQKKVVPTFTDAEIIRLIAQPNRHTYSGYRNYVVMLLLLDTGARVSEVTNLRFKDVDLDNGYVHVLGKGNKERLIPFGRRVAKLLLRYKVKHRPEPMGNDRFFLTSDGRPLTINRIEYLMRHYGLKAGIERCYCHKFRHTFAVTYLRNGGDVFSLQKILGHSSLEIVKIYVNLADKDVKECHKRFSPADNFDMRSRASKDDTAVFSKNFESDIPVGKPMK